MIQEQVEDSLEQTLEVSKFDMCALFVATNTTVGHALDVVQKCNVLIFKKSIMTLDDLRQKVIYQNTLDVWIGVCEEKISHGMRLKVINNSLIIYYTN